MYRVTVLNVTYRKIFVYIKRKRYSL